MKRLDDLRAKLRARDGKPGFEKNCEAIRDEISRLEAELVNSQALEREMLDAEALERETVPDNSDV